VTTNDQGEAMSTTKTRKARTVALRLRVREFSVSRADYPLYEVVLLQAGTESTTGGYVTKRDADGVATGGKGQWWVGICWSTDPEQGPYPTLAAARKAVQTDQVITSALVKRGFRHR
jgi:hypothetical protein